MGRGSLLFALCIVMFAPVIFILWLSYILCVGVLKLIAWFIKGFFDE